MAAEGAAIVEAEAVKNAAGAVVSKIKVARIQNLAIRPPALTAISASDPTKPRNAQTLRLDCSSLQALARLWAHAAPRTSGMNMSTGWQAAVYRNDDSKPVHS